MSNILIALCTALATGLFSLMFLYKFKRIQWLLFLGNMILQTWVVVALYNNPGWSLSLSIPSIIFADIKLTLVLQNSALGYIFYAASVLITLVIAIFAVSYNDKKHATAIAPMWILLMAANIGIFFSADWISFLISWELMSWTAYFIISHGKKDSAKAGLYFFTLSLVGTAALLAAIFIMVGGAQSFLIKDGLKYLKELWQTQSGLVYLVVSLLTLTFFTKSAVIPFYMWPAKAHAEAPDAFSAFLSGIMIKYGIFGLIAFLLPVFGSTYKGPNVFGVPLYLYVMGWIGVATALWGTFHALRENDMKKMMAYSTVSNIGFILAALSVNTAFAIAAALFHTFNHMVFKAGIFLSMASVKYRTGEREMHRLGGMAYVMPLTFFTFLLGIIAAAGIPPMSGFASKWMVFQALFDKKLLLMVIPAFFASTAAFLYLYRGMHAIYLGQLSPRFKDVKEAPFLQSASMMILMLLMFGVGLFPGIILKPISAVITDLGLGNMMQDMSSIKGATTAINVTSIGLVFIGAFVIVFIMFLIGKKRKLVEPMDTYTAGEDPKDWNIYPEKYHYALGFYEPFEVMIKPLLHRFSFERLFKKISFETGRLSRLLQNWFATAQMGLIMMVIVFTLIVLLGGLL